MAWVNSEVLLATSPPTRREAEQVLRYHAMRAKPRFYADENFPEQAVRLLREMGAKVLTAKQRGATGYPDEDHLAYALRERLVLLTCDRDFLDERRFPLIHCAAIFVFDFGSGSLNEMRRAFRCLGQVFRFPQFFDKWWKIDATPDYWITRVRFQNGSTDRFRSRYWKGRRQEWVDR